MDIKLTKFDPVSGQLSSLEKKWTALESKSQNVSFFTSWHWMSTWLKMPLRNLYLLEVVKGEELIALGLFVFGREKALSRQSAYLHKSGEEQLDQVWIEYNNLLTSPEAPSDILQKIMRYLMLSNDSPVQSIQLDMIKNEPFQASEAFYSYQTLLTQGYKKRLNSTDSIESLLIQFSSNTRQQIKRSLRHLDSTIEFKTVSKTTEKQNYLKVIAKQHIKQWQHTEWGSGFENSHFVNFHETLILDDNTVILSLEKEGDVVAAGYYFLYRNVAYFYLSAIKKHSDNKIKWGLIFHVMAMEYFASQGYDEYDFLAGDARYKKSLSDCEYQLQSIRLVKRNWLGLIEAWARKLKLKLYKN